MMTILSSFKNFNQLFERPCMGGSSAEFVAQSNRELLVMAIVSTSTSELKTSGDSVAAKKDGAKRDAPPSFKTKSNKDQFNPCKFILDAVEARGNKLERTDLVKAKESLDERYVLIN